MSNGSSKDFGSTTTVHDHDYDEPYYDDENDNGEKMNKPGVNQWTSAGINIYQAVGTTWAKLPSGMYEIGKNMVGFTFNLIPLKVDELMLFPNTVGDRVLQEVETFWTQADKYKNIGVLHRRGYMFYGPPGTGKTCLVHQITNDIIKRGGLVINCGHSTHSVAPALAEFRKVEPDRPLVCLFEDIDSIISQFGESALLGLLDGQYQIDKVLNIGTTNYPERLNRRIIARPRRFDSLIKVDFPDAKVREFYFKNKLNIPDKEVKKWVTASEKFSFAACTELVVSVQCMGKPFDKAVTELKALNEKKASSLEDGLNQ